MAARYSIRRKAAHDLDEIADYILKDNPERAISFVKELMENFARIADFPEAHSDRGDLKPRLRSAVHGNYLIFFTASDHGIEIVRVIHGARHLPGLF